MATLLDPIFEAMVQFGLPQLLAFVIMMFITYGVLAKSKLFGDPDNKRTNVVNSIISVAVAALVLISPIGAIVSLWFTKFFVHVLVVLVVMLAVFIFAGFGGYDFSKEIKKRSWVIGGMAAIGFLLFLNAGGFDLFGLAVPGLPTPFFDIPPEAVNQLIAVLIILGIFGGSLYALVKSGSGGRSSGGSSP